MTGRGHRDVLQELKKKQRHEKKHGGGDKEKVVKDHSVKNSRMTNTKNK